MRFKDFNQSPKVCGEKCAEYQITIIKLIDILQKFLLGIDYKISHSTHSYNRQLYGAETMIILNNFLVVKQFGKGFTKLEAIVSAYAEIIERIQLLYTFFSHNPFKSVLTFHFLNNSTVPDDTLFLNKKYATLINKNNPFFNSWFEKPRDKWLKIYDIFKREEAYLHYRFLHNPSGTAAGNTYEEAFIQGLCEIFERYCVGKVLLNQIECPSISIEVFNEKNQHYLRLLGQEGIKFYIKDMSLNKGFPTIGLLCDFEEKKEMNPYYFGKKRFHLQVGSGTSMDIALERTLVELYQVIGHVKKLSIEEEAHQSRIGKMYKTFPLLNDLIPENAFHCLLFIKKAFISDIFLEHLLHDIGTFTPWSYHDDDDCLVEVKKLLTLLKNNDYHVYLMDYSWLEFPTLLVVVPELHFGYNEILYESRELINFKKKLICDFEKITKSELKILEKERTIINVALNPSLDNFLSIEVDLLKATSTWFFLGMLAKAFDLREIAKKYFSQLIPFEIEQLNVAIRYNGSNIIKKYLKKLLPSCHKSCEICSYKKECKYYHTKDLQESVAQAFPSYFKLHTKYDSY